MGGVGHAGRRAPSVEWGARRKVGGVDPTLTKVMAAPEEPFRLCISEDNPPGSSPSSPDAACTDARHLASAQHCTPLQISQGSMEATINRESKSPKVNLWWL